MTDPRRAEAVDLYRGGLPLSGVAARLSMWAETIKGWLQEEGIHVRTTAEQKRLTLLADPRGAQAAEMYREGMALRVIAKELGAGSGTVKTWLEQAGVPLRRTVARRREPLPIVPAEVARLYHEGMKINQLRAHYGVRRETIRAALGEAGVRLRRNTRRTADPDTVAKVRALFEEGYSADTDAMLALVSMGEANDIFWEMRGWHPCPVCGAGMVDVCDMCQAEEEKLERDAEAKMWGMAGTFRVRYPAYLEAGG